MAKIQTKVHFLLSSNPANLATALAGYTKTATVEAEYGEVVVSGSVMTLAHHGPRQHFPCPCLLQNFEQQDDIDVVGLSHIDLDTLGACAAIIGCKPDAEDFWILAAFVDVKGAHKLAQSYASAKDIRRLHAFWAWSQKNRVFAPRDGSVADVTGKVIKGIEVLSRVLADDEQLLTEGDQFKAEEAALNAKSYVGRRDDVVIRKSDVFVNHLYVCPDGYVGKIVVALNTKTNGVTVSLSDLIPGRSCRTIVQNLWGEKAGGHDGIAGSPRDQKMAEVDLERAVTATVAALSGNS